MIGDRELRGKTGPSTSSCRRSRGCGRTGHRCASRRANAEDVERLFKESMDAFGKPDVVVHCAGIMPLFPIASGDVPSRQLPQFSIRFIP
jgi:NAD(P)-dependent dehydrogenase (short-subunit alcohol dehydrogenase family)